MPVEMCTNHFNSCVFSYVFCVFCFRFVSFVFFLICFNFWFLIACLTCSLPAARLILGIRKRKKHTWVFYFTRACVTMCRFYFRMRDKYLLAQTYFFVCICVFMCWQGRTFQRTHVLWQFFADLSWFYITVYIQFEQRSTVKIHCIFINIAFNIDRIQCETLVYMKELNESYSAPYKYTAMCDLTAPITWCMVRICSFSQSFIRYSITFGTVSHNINKYIILFRCFCFCCGDLYRFFFLYYNRCAGGMNQNKNLPLDEAVNNENMQCMSICVWSMWFSPVPPFFTASVFFALAATFQKY